MSTMLSEKNGVRTRKANRCCLCGEGINVGDLKDVRSGVCSDGFWTMQMHHECHVHEMIKGNVDPYWYDDISEPAFKRPITTS